MVFQLLLLVIICLVAYVRFAPQNLEKWHVVPVVEMDEILRGGVKKRAEVSIVDLDALIFKEPRTRRVAGTPESGFATYVTRSKLWGFPDYTTIKFDGDEVLIYARLVFGRSDFGVNAARVDRWVRALTTD